MPLPNLHTLPRLEAQLLLAHVLGRSRAWVIAHPEADLSPEQKACLDAALTRREAGVPLPYVLGEWEFFGIKFIVTPEVLIPRPETELLVETALSWLLEHPKVKSAVDVGTGSGCIAVTLAKYVPTLHMTALDHSAAALEVARQNAARHQVTARINFQQSDLLNYLDLRAHPIELLLANLPYIPSQTLHNLPVFGREPTLALDGGEDGLILIRRLLKQASTCLAPVGLALLEIDARQGESAQILARQFFEGASIQVLPDLAGLDRLLVIQRGG